MNIGNYVKSAGALLLAILALVSCSGPAGTSTDVTTSAANTNSPTVTTASETEPSGPVLDQWGREVIDDGIPKDLNFGGKAVKMLTREDIKDRWRVDFYVPELTGEYVNDAIYNRNLRIESRLGVEFTVTEGPGGHTDFSSYSNMITKAYQAGTHEFDLVCTLSRLGAQYATQGYFYNFNDLDSYLDFDKVWWNQNFAEELSIDDKLFFVVGDVNLTAISRMLTIFYNKEEMEKRMPELDIYEAVNTGKWTLDYMTEIISNAYADLNGDTVKSEGDFFGLSTIAPSEAYDSMAAATDFRMVIRNAEGELTINPDTEGILNRLAKVSQLYYSNENAVMLDPNADVELSLKRFANGESLFTIYALDKSGEAILRDMPQVYGVLPLPKYDEAQDMYRTIPQDYFNLISIMGDTEDPDMIAAVLELMCAESYKEVVPLYYEEALKFKYMPDEDSGKMIDYLRDGLTFDFATINTNSLGNGGGSFMQAFFNQFGKDAASRLTSSLAMKNAMYNTYLKKLISAYEKIDN